MKTLNRLTVAGILALLAGLAQAQYVWVDEHGRKQLSDRPPPTSVPAKNILKQPGGVPQATDAEPAAAAPSAAAAPTLAEREADYKKRHLEQAEKDAKAAEEAKQKQAQTKDCALARAAQAQLASGQRLGIKGNNGERGYMSDAERTQNSAQARRILDGCK